MDNIPEDGFCSYFIMVGFADLSRHANLPCKGKYSLISGRIYILHNSLHGHSSLHTFKSPAHKSLLCCHPRDSAPADRFADTASRLHIQVQKATCILSVFDIKLKISEEHIS